MMLLVMVRVRLVGTAVVSLVCKLGTARVRLRCLEILEGLAPMSAGTRAIVALVMLLVLVKVGVVVTAVEMVKVTARGAMN